MKLSITTSLRKFAGLFICILIPYVCSATQNQDPKSHTRGTSFTHSPAFSSSDQTAELTSITDLASLNVSVTLTPNLLPGDRVYDWTYSGVPGGIPNRTNIHATLNPSATAAQINDAIFRCSSAGGGVVYLSAGTYHLSGTIEFGNSKGVTLRGAGAGRTILLISRRIKNSDRTYSEEQGIPISSGYTKGSTAIILDSRPTANFAAGNIICISEDPSPDKWGRGVGVYYRTGLPTGSSVYNLSQTRCFRHMNRIVGVKGNTINLAAPIPLDFSASLNVRAYPPSTSGCTSLCGLENMTVDAQNKVDTPIYLISADRCWIKNVELKNVPGSDIGMIRIYQSFQCEIRRCYIHDATGYPNQADGYAISLNYGASNCLLEDNIVDRVAELCETNGAAGNAYLFNYVRDTGRVSHSQMDHCIGRGTTLNHGPHGFMNLLEGNILPSVVNDGYHGSTSHIVIFRNHINGLNSDPYLYWHRRLINLCRGSYYHTVIGNIIGDSSWKPFHYSLKGAHGYNNDWSIYSLGYPAADTSGMHPYTDIPWTNWSKSTSTPDADVAQTLLRHGNFDYYSKTVVWDDGIASRTIPKSLVYRSKPKYFGSLQWPPIGPDVSGLVSSTPAKARWDAYTISGNLDDLFLD